MKRDEKRRDIEKERYWRKVIREAAQSGVSSGHPESREATPLPVGGR